MGTLTRTDRALLPPVTNESRGEAIRLRREALGIPNPHQFAQATGRDRETITRAEAGAASATTMDWLEGWLDTEEAKRGTPEPATGGEPLRIEMHGAYGIEEIIVTGPVDRPEELAEAVSKILDRLQKRDPK